MGPKEQAIKGGPEVVALTIAAGDEGRRIDAYLAGCYPQFSRNLFIKLVRQEQVRVDGRPIKPSFRLAVGQRISCVLPEDTPRALAAEKTPLSILFEDEVMLAVDKPAGMTVHPGAGCRAGTLLNALLGSGRPLADTGDQERPGLVHRLDKETSGVLLVAKTASAHLALSRQFAGRLVRKEYYALVHGNPAFDRGRWDWPLGRDPRCRKKRRVELTSRGRSAITDYEVKKRWGGSPPRWALLICYPRTGRTHQIRVHLARAGHPVLCDKVYGRESSFLLGGRLLLTRHALHAWRIAFLHPRDGREITITAPLPEDLQRVLAALSAMKTDLRA